MEEITTSIDEVFGETGLLASHLDQFEFRPQQTEMGHTVWDCLSSKINIVVEAGTGVGKSFAYLVPAILDSLKQKKPAIISTNTISLQEQLIEKDIPFLQQVIPQPFKATLVKGRSNYLCLRRLQRAIHQKKNIFEQEAEILALGTMQAWVEVTKDGSLSDIEQEPPSQVWSKVCCENGNCRRKKCKFYEKCFYMNSRKKIYSSDLLVVNHHLFFSNLALMEEDHGFLPEAGCIVMDEAHSIEDVAGKHLGLEISNGMLDYLFSQLFSQKKKMGFLSMIGDTESIKIVKQAVLVAKAFFKNLRTLWKDKREKFDNTIRMRGKQLSGKEISEILSLLSISMSKYSRTLEDDDDFLECKSYIEKVRSFSDSFSIFCEQKLEGYVYWTEIGGRNDQRLSICASPIDVGEKLGPLLFDRDVPIVCTSATLATDTGQPFEYFKSRLGIKATEELQCGSPFDFSRQVNLHINRNIPEPENIQGYEEGMISYLVDFLRKREGGTFILFTSYSLLNKVYNRLEPYMAEIGVAVYRQGSGMPRTKMLKEFRNNTDSVLFGTDTFWAGIDIKGDALKNVIITRLPFVVPTHPIHEAKMERISELGGNPFLEYTVPEAIIKFRQGFGRLIRTQMDTGNIIILDKRIVSRPYGKHFLNAIPECNISYF